MGKRFIIGLIACLLVASLCACGNIASDTSDEAKDTVVIINAQDLIGEWSEAVGGRGMMTVTAVDGEENSVYFEVVWSDSASSYHQFRFLGTLNEDGKLVYDNGFVGVVDCDEDGNETKTIIEEEASGTVELVEDGTMIWTEDAAADNPHEFVRNA